MGLPSLGRLGQRSGPDHPIQLHVPAPDRFQDWKTFAVWRKPISPSTAPLLRRSALRRRKPAVEIGQRACRNGTLLRHAALLALDAVAGCVVRGGFEQREKTEVDVHRLE